MLSGSGQADLMQDRRSDEKAAKELFVDDSRASTSRRKGARALKKKGTRRSVAAETCEHSGTLMFLVPMTK